MSDRPVFYQNAKCVRHYTKRWPTLSETKTEENNEQRTTEETKTVQRQGMNYNKGDKQVRKKTRNRTVVRKEDSTEGTEGKDDEKGKK